MWTEAAPVYSAGNDVVAVVADAVLVDETNATEVLLVDEPETTGVLLVDEPEATGVLLVAPTAEELA